MAAAAPMPVGRPPAPGEPRYVPYRALDPNGHSITRFREVKPPEQPSNISAQWQRAAPPAPQAPPQISARATYNTAAHLDSARPVQSRSQDLHGPIVREEAPRTPARTYASHTPPTRPVETARAARPSAPSLPLPPPPSPPPPQTAPAETRSGEYSIQRGDTLSAIAQQHGTSIQALADINNIADPNKIRAGATLRTAESPSQFMSRADNRSVSETDSRLHVQLAGERERDPAGFQSRIEQAERDGFRIKNGALERRDASGSYTAVTIDPNMPNPLQQAIDQARAPAIAPATATPASPVFRPPQSQMSPN